MPAIASSPFRPGTGRRGGRIRILASLRPVNLEFSQRRRLRRLWLLKFGIFVSIGKWIKQVAFFRNFKLTF